MRSRHSRAGEAGLLRGCCFGVVLLVILLGGGGFVAIRALAAPDLGAPPGGMAHGNTEAVIAAALAGSAGTQLVAAQHAVVVLSERDLTVLAIARNPAPDRLRNPQARIRGGVVVVSADAGVGPFGVTAVVRLQLTFSDAGGQAQVDVQPLGYAIGQLAIPDWIAARVAPNGSSSLNLTQLFNANPALEALAQSMECVSVEADGVHVGFHRPGVAADSTRCTSGVAAAAP